MFTFGLSFEKAKIRFDFTSETPAELWYFECRHSVRTYKVRI